MQKNLEHINNKDTVLYPKELVRLINKLFNFDYDQQDSYELYHRILDILDSFLVNYKVDRDFSGKKFFKCLNYFNISFFKLYTNNNFIFLCRGDQF